MYEQLEDTLSSFSLHTWLLGNRRFMLQGCTAAILEGEALTVYLHLLYECQLVCFFNDTLLSLLTSPRTLGAAYYAAIPSGTHHGSFHAFCPRGAFSLWPGRCLLS